MDLNEVRKVRDLIARLEPEACGMDDFFHGDVPAIDLNADTFPEIKCGTSACVAGWTLASHGITESEHTAWDNDGAAARILGVPETGSVTPLFYRESWPPEFEKMARESGDKVAMLAILDAILDGELDLERRDDPSLGATYLEWTGSRA